MPVRTTRYRRTGRYSTRIASIPSIRCIRSPTRPHAVEAQAKLGDRGGGNKVRPAQPAVLAVVERETAVTGQVGERIHRIEGIEAILVEYRPVRSEEHTSE